MKFGLHSLFTMEEMRLSQPIKALGVFIVYANVVSERVTPRSHLRGHHRKIECALLPLQHLAQFTLAGCLLDGVGRVIDSATPVPPLRRRAKRARRRQIAAFYDFQTSTI